MDFLARCLAFNPTARMSAKEALAHPFLAQFHDEAAEPVAAHALRISVDDNTKYTAADYRDRLYKDIAARKKASLARKAKKEGQAVAAAETASEPAPPAAAAAGAASA